MLTIDEINHILTSLLEMPDETETVEFKKAENSFSDSDLGKYFSALSNEANLKRTKQAWLILGVENSTHQIVGTSYKPSRASLDELKKKLADQTTNRITFEEIYTVDRNGKRVIMFQIPPAPQGVPMAYQGHFYGRDGESLVALNLHELETIRNQRIEDDWSIQTVSNASLEDLDPEALKKARGLYQAAHSDKKEEIMAWDDATPTPPSCFWVNLKVKLLFHRLLPKSNGS